MSDRNHFVHVEFAVNDLLIAKKFYSRVFSWEITDNPAFPDYLFFNTGDEEFSGGLSLTQSKPTTGTSVFYINVSDINDKLQVVTENGGKIILEKTTLPGDQGFIGRFEDPFGNILGIWTRP